MNELILADCFDELKKLPDNSVDLILTDPPYGIDYKLNIGKLDRILNDKAGDIDFSRFFDECYRVLKDKGSMYLFGRCDFFCRIGNEIQKSKFKYMHELLWIKGDMGSGNIGIFGQIHENIIGLSKGTPRKSQPILIDGEIKQRSKGAYWGKISTKEYCGHPTQKPVGLCAYIIENRTVCGDVVLDPFAGSGSTLFAAKALDRQWIGIELDPKFYEMSKNRLEDIKSIEKFKKTINQGYITYNGLITLPKQFLIEFNEL
jgi:site-specific DNA-methyltransferase (adenine-specific)